MSEEKERINPIFRFTSFDVMRKKNPRKLRVISGTIRERNLNVHSVRKKN